MSAILQDLRFGFRMFRKDSGFTAVAVLTLALGIGANTAIFRLLDAVRLRTLPVHQPHELAEIRIGDFSNARGNFESWNPVLTNPIWEKIRDGQQGFSGTFAWATVTFDLSKTGAARFSEGGLFVSGDFFNVLGIRPVVGRLFTPADDRRGCSESVAVISHAFWQQEFGGDPATIGRKIALDRHPFEIIGVTSPGFFGLEVGRSYEVAVPLCAERVLRGEGSRLDSGTSWWLTVMGRLKPGWSLDRATAQLQGISPALFRATLPPTYPAANVSFYLAYQLGAYAAPGGISRLREDYTNSLWLLLGITGLVLLITCANLANLLLARGSTRAREIAVRLALGASRGRLVRQLLAESLMLSAAGAGLGVLLALWISQFLVSLLSSSVTQAYVSLDPDWRMLGFSALLGVVTCALFGLAPALRATTTDSDATLKAGGRSTADRPERLGLRRALVVSQVALSLVVLVGALLFARTFQNLLTVDVGFQQEGILQTDADWTPVGVAPENRAAFQREMLAKVRALPGVNAAATAAGIPLLGNSWSNNVWMDDAGRSARSAPSARSATKPGFFNRVSDGYFATFNIPLLAGRDFDDRDARGSQNVAIVNEEFAAQFVGGQNPVGRRFWVETTPNDPETLYEIVGYVGNTKYQNLREPQRPVIFLADTQAPRRGTYSQILIRTQLPLDSMMGAVSGALSELHPKIEFHYHIFREQILDGLIQERLLATLASLFGLLASLLATLGLYGFISFLAARRTNEIGIRMALGAERRDILRLVIREAGQLLVVGLVVGCGLALAAGTTVRAMLFDIAPYDPVTFVLAAVALGAVTLTAAWLPARRAAGLDPMVALRHD